MNLVPISDIAGVVVLDRVEKVEEAAGEDVKPGWWWPDRR